MQRAQRRLRAHTLIEAMFASFLALACALIFSATIPVANLTRGKADNMNAATSLAQKMIERVRHDGYPNASNAQFVANGLADSSTLSSTSAYGCGPVGEQALEFTNVDSGLVDSPAKVLPGGKGYIYATQTGIDLRQVTVIVAWKEKSVTKSVRLTTLVANL